MTELENRSVNFSYLILPGIVGLVPSALCALLYFLSQVGGSASEAFTSVFAAYLIFIMLYAYAPALLAHYLGYEVLQSPSGAMISCPNTAIAWLIVICFYLIVGILINRIIGIRIWR